MLAALVKQDGDPKGSYQGRFSDLRYPLLASPKIDGIRCLCNKGQVRSRKNLPIPNEWIRTHIGMLGDGPDGEIVTYTDGVMDDFHTVQSKVMSEDGMPDFKYMIFDYVHDGFEWEEYTDRLKVSLLLVKWGESFVKQVGNIIVYNEEHLNIFESECLLSGYEGVCLRSPSSPYKSGRSTFDQHYLLKLKRFSDAEATVIGVEPLERNLNEATIDETGHTKRSHAQAGKVTDLLRVGALVVRDLKTNVEFRLSGFTDKQRLDLMANPPIGQIVTYRHQPYGAKPGGAPRIPVFRGVRHDLNVDNILHE